MRIISRKVLREYGDRHAGAKEPLDVWFRIAKAAAWRHLAEVRHVFPTADFVDGSTVFNIKGNAYRLVTVINYAAKIVFIRGVFTHADYEKGSWRDG